MANLSNNAEIFCMLTINTIHSIHSIHKIQAMHTNDLFLNTVQPVAFLNYDVQLIKHSYADITAHPTQYILDAVHTYAYM